MCANREAGGIGDVSSSGPDRLKSLNDMRKEHIERVLEGARGDELRAAEILCISLPELHRWMNKLGIAGLGDCPESGRNA